MAHILVVDDSGFSRSLIRHVLEHGGHTVVEAAGGLEALEKAAAETFDVITIDLLMPGMRGKELVERLLQQAPNARLLVLSADVQDTTRQEMLSLGVHAFLNKPIKAEALLQAVEQVLQHAG